MGIVSGIVVFSLIWWVTLFTVLPFSVKRDETGKADDPQLKKKALITTGLAIVLWFIVYFLIEQEIMSFRDLAEEMARND